MYQLLLLMILIVSSLPFSEISRRLSSYFKSEIELSSKNEAVLYENADFKKRKERRRVKIKFKIDDFDFIFIIKFFKISSNKKKTYKNMTNLNFFKSFSFSILYMTINTCNNYTKRKILSIFIYISKNPIS